MQYNKRKSSRLNLAAILLCAVVAVSVSGCFGNGRQPLGGSVTLDGKPINGSISFDPMGETRGPSTGGAIRGGKFDMPKAIGLLPGKYAVTIQTSRKTGRIINDNGLVVEEMFPVSFNEEESLEVDIVVGDNQFKFELTSKKQI